MSFLHETYRRSGVPGPRYRFAAISALLASGAVLPTVAPGQSAGDCYDVQVSAWVPARIPGPDSILVRPPPRIQFDPSLATATSGRIRPAPRAMPSVYGEGFWSRIAPDSLRLEWGSWATAIQMRLRVDGDLLVGTVRSFGDVPRQSEMAYVIARRVACDAPLREADRADYRYPRGIVPEGADSVRLNERLPDRLALERVADGQYRILDTLTGMYSGAQEVEVRVGQDGRVYHISLTYPLEITVEDLVGRLGATLGEPTMRSPRSASWMSRMIRIDVSSADSAGTKPIIWISALGVQPMMPQRPPP